MYSKLTLFGEQNSGKTTILKYLTYLMLKHNASNIVAYIDNAGGNSKNAYHSSVTPSMLNALYSTLFINAKTSPDFNITLFIKKPHNNAVFSVCICTGGDICERIISNWKYATCQRCKDAQTSEDITINEADIFISACRNDEEVIDIEQLKQRSRIMDNDGTAINFLYWFKSCIDGKFNQVVRNTIIDEELFKDATNTIFKPNKKNTPMRYYAQYATLIEQKIENLSKLL